MPSAANLYADSNEALIVGLAKTGDGEAFAELVRRRQSWIRQLMRGFCHDTDRADDLAQQAFLQAWRKIRQLRESHAFGAWLKRIAVSTALQYLRRHDALDEAGDWQEVHSATARQPGLAMDLERALSALSGAERVCVVLAYHECMTHPEIAEVTGMPLGTVKSHIRRGSERMKAALRDYDMETADEVASS